MPTDLRSLDGLKEIGARCKLFILCEVPDNVAANVRKKQAMAFSLPENCLYASGLGCTVHRIHRLVEATETQLVGDVYAISFVCSVPRYRATMLETLKRVVARELQVLDFEDPAWSEQRDAILEHTLGREFHVTKAVPWDKEAPADTQRDQKSLRQRLDLINTFLIGDPKFPAIQHVSISVGPECPSTVFVQKCEAN